MLQMGMRLQDRNPASRVRSTNLLTYVFLNVLLLCGMALSDQAQAITYPEIEPNDPCTSAQDLRSAAGPLQVTGYKTQPFGNAVDFFRFHGTPGTQGRITLDGDFSKPNPLTAYGVGFFTSDCPSLPQGSNFTFGAAAFLDFTVPGNGESGRRAPLR